MEFFREEDKAVNSAILTNVMIDLPLMEWGGGSRTDISKVIIIQ